ncbi:MAG: hypothetical protein MUC48_04720, partial [Leptolyngbya sp. Prado105]|nr:hypothetical protein [Leptolyngbya sp. Prado105]
PNLNLRNELTKEFNETAEKLNETATILAAKEAKWAHVEKELREKLHSTEVECANAKANGAILEAQLKKRMQNEHELASQVSGLASRLAEAASESNENAKKYDQSIADLHAERKDLIDTVEDLTHRLKGAAKAMETMRAQQLKIIDGAISHEQIVSKALEAHAQIVTDAARQQQELEIAKEERAIILNLLAKQDEAYKNTIFPKADQKRLVVEAASSFGWQKYMGSEGDMISIERFGISAPGGVAMEKFGYTVDNVVTRAKAVMGK